MTAEFTHAEWTKKLYEECPNLFKQHNLSMKVTCMCWGFEIPTEWFPIIHKLSLDLEQLIEAQIQEGGEHAEAVQVKEKYGGLRFYLQSHETEEMSKLIVNAETEVENLDKSNGKCPF